MSSERVDVLVIGAGVGGGVVAKRCAEAGFSVLCLEQGDWPDRADYPGKTAEWELVAAKQYSGVPSERNAPSDYPIEFADSDYGVLNWNGVGGGTVLYNAQWPRMLAGDFRVHSVDGVAEDWPLGYDDLRPYYEATDRDFGVSGLGGNPAYPSGEDPPLPPLPIGPMGLRLARAHAKLGWHWWPGTNAILTVPRDGRHACVQRGTCMSGCNEGAKASADLTHWRVVERLGGRVITGARVRRIVVDTTGLACGAEWFDRDGRGHFQPADVVVCAANGIGTPRLLLASDGLANSSGLVGRNLMLHPLAAVAAVFDAPGGAWRAHAGALVHSLQFAHSDPSRGFVRGATWSLSTWGGPLGALYSPDGSGRWATEHHAHVRERFGRSATWVIIAEDLPDADNRVELSSTRFDDAGLAAPRITYRGSENTRRLIDWNLERARESLEMAGAVSTESIRFPANGHLMGTARMGTDPTRSVVDPDCRSHDVPNLLIPDGSVFVTAGSANPTTTIAALALRAAERLIAARANLPRPSHETTVAVPASLPVHSQASIESVPAGSLGDAERLRFCALADEWIPSDGSMPAASEVGVANELLDRVLDVRPDLRPAVRAALASDAPLPDELLRLLRYVAAAAYYLSPDVRRMLDYDPENVVTVSAREFPEYVAEGLLDEMLEDSR